MRRALFGWLALGLAACAGAPVGGAPATAADPPLAAGRPIGRAEHPVAGDLAYHLASLRRDGDAVVVDLDLMNGTPDRLRGAVFGLTLHGPAGASRSERVMAGPIAAGRTKRIFARIPGVPFRVEDVTLELLGGAP